MNKFLLVLGGAALGIAGYVVYNNSLSASTADGLSGKTDLWGAKNRVKGTGGILGGKLEQGLGQLTNDPAVEGKGVLDETVGRVKDAAGQAAHAVSDTIDDMKS